MNANVCGLRGIALAVTLCLFLPASAVAVDALGADVTQRLERDGVERANAWLSGAPQAMAALNQRTADCEPVAVGLAVRLSRTKSAKAARLHQESLRVAVGACTELVLSQLSASEVPRICAAASAWTITQTARELRRRIAQLEIDEGGGATERGKACHAAYVHELHHTRVGLRVAPARREGR